MSLPIRRTASLRRGRISMPSTRYFLTLCTQNRESVLTDPLNAERGIATWLELEASGDLKLLAATLMPDHLHALFVLGDRLPLSQVMSKYKTLSTDHGRASWRWQQNGFEHRLRENEDPSDYAFYIFMNPYRAKLIKPSERWLWWLCPEPSQQPFLEHLHDGCPPVEWIERIEQVAQRITSGE